MFFLHMMRILLRKILQNQGGGEYVFESDILADTNVARTSDAMALSFLCT